MITEVAKLKIKHFLAEDTRRFFRVKVTTGGCNGFSYSFETIDAASVTNNDNKLSIDDNLKLVTDPATDKMLKNATLDYVDEIGQAGFQIVNPDAKNTCGCGISFDF